VVLVLFNIFSGFLPLAHHFWTSTEPPYIKNINHNSQGHLAGGLEFYIHKVSSSRLLSHTLAHMIL